MHKWEYMFVSAAWADDQWRIKYINGKEYMVGKNSITLFDYANKIGEEGWELTSHSYTVATSTNQVTGHIYDFQEYYKLIFKRPKPG